jgi:hypothetical protein
LPFLQDYAAADLIRATLSSHGVKIEDFGKNTKAIETTKSDTACNPASSKNRKRTKRKLPTVGGDTIDRPTVTGTPTVTGRRLMRMAKNKRQRDKRHRADDFVAWLVTTYRLHQHSHANASAGKLPLSRHHVLDVAGGKGKVSYLLVMKYGIR